MERNGKRQEKAKSGEMRLAGGKRVINQRNEDEKERNLLLANTRTIRRTPTCWDLMRTTPERQGLRQNINT